MSPAEPRRTAEIEEITNRYLIHPVASRLVPLLAKAHVAPNVVSVAGMVFGISAGAAYYRYRALEWTIAGFLLMLAWHVMDGADGQLARLTGSQSHFGKVLDGISDTVTFAAVYTGLALGLGRGAEMYVLIAIAGACHAVQSASYELERQEYDFLGWSRQPSPAARLDSSGATVLDRLVRRLDRLFYVRLSFPAARITREVREAVAQALQRQPGRAPTIRQCYRDMYAPVLREWSILSANYRTLGIFIAAILGAPQGYFAFEIAGFTAILAWLLHRQRARYGTFLAALECVAGERAHRP